MAPGESTPTYHDMLRERGPLGTYRLVQIEADDRIMMITLNDPASLNWYSVPMTGELRQALQHAEEDSATLVVVLTGVGKAFSAGGDLRACATATPRHSSAMSSSGASSAT